MRIACVSIPAFAARVARQCDPTLHHRPIIVSGLGADRLRVVACTEGAQRDGIRLGMPLSGVTALCPEATVVSLDPVAVEAVWTTILAVLLLVSPVVESEEPGRAYLDLKGLYHLYASPDHLLTAIEQAVSPDWRAKVGAGPGKFAAWLAANAARPGQPLGLNLRTVAAFRRRQPCATLPIAETTRARLKRLGLKTLGEVADLPRGAVLAQFGFEGGRLWDHAAGRDETRLTPYTPPARIIEIFELEEPTSLLTTLAMAIAALTRRALRHPALGGRLARQLTLSARLEDGRTWATTVTLKGASADPNRLTSALRARLNAAPPDGPVEALTLELTDFGGVVGQQPPLFYLNADGSLPPRDDLGLATAVDELKARYGVSPLARVIEVEPWSRLPERRYMLVDYEP